MTPIHGETSASKTAMSASRTQGIRSLLGLSWAYQAFFDVIGGPKRNRVLVREYIFPKPGDRILDIGSGPGTIVPYFQDVKYVGVDGSAEYIEQARRRYPGLEFVCQRVSEYHPAEKNCFDIVLALGILHHLDDLEAASLFQLAYETLKPGGRLVTLDGVRTDGQSGLVKYLLRHDRGRFVRREEEYLAIARKAFPEARSQVRHDLLRIPYSHVILTCVR